MSLSENDKKFIKENINSKFNNLEKKVDNLAAKSFKDAYKPGNGESGKRLSEIQKQQQEKRDTAALIELLEEKNKNGEATIAEKIELMSKTLKSSIPDDFIDGVKALSGSVKEGASQTGKGLAHLNKRLMMSNPLTAMLYQNRDILGALKDVGVGTLKMGWGVTKGISTGAAGLINNAINLKKKKKEKKEIQEEAEIIEEAITTTKQKEEEEQEKTASEYILEMHDFLFNDLKNYIGGEKQEKTKLQKGLSGIGKTFKSVAGVIDLIASKQKLIANMLLLGAMAIVGIKKWLDSGKLQKLVKDAIDGILNPDKEYKDYNTDAYSNNYAPSIQSSVLEGEEYNQYLNENKSNFTGVSGGSEVITSTNEYGGQEYKKQFNVGNLTPVLAPIDGIISSYDCVVGSLNGGQQKAYFSFTLAGQIGSPDGLTNRQIRFRFENIINPKVYNGLKVSMNQILGFSDGSFKMTAIGGGEAALSLVKDYGSFINKEKENNWENAIKATENNLTEKDYKEVKNAIVNESLKDHAAKRRTSKHTNGFANGFNTLYNKSELKSQEAKDKAADALAGKSEAVILGKTYQEEIPNPTRDPFGPGKSPNAVPSANEKKIEEQVKEIKNKEQELKDQEKKTEQAQNKADQNTNHLALIQPTLTTRDMPSDAINPNLIQSMTSSNISAIG